MILHLLVYPPSESEGNTTPSGNGEVDLGVDNEKQFPDETDDSTRSSGQFRLQPTSEEQATSSLQRSAQNFFNRQTTKLPPKPSPLTTSSLNAVPEDDRETPQGSKLQVILQPSNGAATPANATPPALRPQALQLLKQKSTETAQQ